MIIFPIWDSLILSSYTRVVIIYTIFYSNKYLIWTTNCITCSLSQHPVKLGELFVKRSLLVSVSLKPDIMSDARCLWQVEEECTFHDVTLS